MADFQFQQQAPGQFINPDYATPEQKEYLRRLAAQLMGSATSQQATSLPGAIAQGLQGMNAGYYANQARKGDIANQLLNTALAGQLSGQAQPGVPGALPTNPTQPPAQGQGGTLGFGEPRGIRNNNPGNIKDSPFAQSQPGYAGRDNGGFAVFQTPQHGQMAMDKLLQNYAGKGLTSPAGIINRWAPPSENDTSGYAATVSKKLGVSPTASLNMQDPGVRRQLEEAMATVETGRPMSFAPQSGMTQELSAQQRPMQMAQAGSGRPPQFDPATIGALMTYGRPEDQAAARAMIMPQPWKSATGQEGVSSLAGGITPRAVTGGLVQDVLVPKSVQTSREGASVSTQGLLGGGGQGFQQGVQPMMDVAKGLQQQSAASGAVAGQVGQDVTQAASNPQVQQTLATMKDDILSHGDKMVWGPAADWLNNFKRNIAQFAPGLMTEEDLKGLASADSFEKLSAQLQSMIGRQVGSTDASLFQGMKSVPGSHNSKEGALALIDMLSQISALNTRFVVQNQARFGMPGVDYLAEKNKFYEQNPIHNPITKNPIRLDLQGKGTPSETRVIKGKTYYKINGTWHEGT